MHCECECESEVILIEILWSCLSKIIVRIRHNSASASASSWVRASTSASFVLFVLRFNQEVFNCVVYFNWQLTISSRIYFSYPLRASHQQFIPLTSPQTEARSPKPTRSASLRPLRVASFNWIISNDYNNNSDSNSNNNVASNGKKSSRNQKIFCSVFVWFFFSFLFFFFRRSCI